MIRLSSSDTDTPEIPAPTDEGREALVEALTAELGDALVATEIEPGHDLWVRVATDAWSDVAAYLRERQRYRFFEWLSAIDWKPSPFGRSLDSEVDIVLGNDEPSETATEIQHGVTGGDTRFQVIARLHNLSTAIGITLKVDVDSEAPQVGTWTGVYPGAAWHEREVWEMFGIGFVGHPGLRNLYLPGDFEGNPMRKDFPLLSRLIKPWPGIVDVEPMPEPDEAPAAPETAAPEAGGDDTPAGEAS